MPRLKKTHTDLLEQCGWSLNRKDAEPILYMKLENQYIRSFPTAYEFYGQVVFRDGSLTGPYWWAEAANYILGFNNDYRTMANHKRDEEFRSLHKSRYEGEKLDLSFFQNCTDDIIRWAKNIDFANELAKIHLSFLKSPYLDYDRTLALALLGKIETLVEYQGVIKAKDKSRAHISILKPETLVKALEVAHTPSLLQLYPYESVEKARRIIKSS